MSDPIDVPLIDPATVDTTAEASRPTVGRGRTPTRPWRSGFCSCGNHLYCPGDVTNGSLAGGHTILCACTCHTPDTDPLTVQDAVH